MMRRACLTVLVLGLWGCGIEFTSRGGLGGGGTSGDTSDAASSASGGGVGADVGQTTSGPGGHGGAGGGGCIPCAQAILWLRADAIEGGPMDGDPVATWNDVSGHAHDAVQADATRRPTYAASLLGGMPAVRFDGVDDRLGIVGTAPLSSISFFTVHRLLAGATAPASYMLFVFGEYPDEASKLYGVETRNAVSGDSPDVIDVLAALSNDARATLPGIAAFDEWKIFAGVTTATIHNTTVWCNGAAATMSGTGTDAPLDLLLGNATGTGFGGIGGVGRPDYNYVAKADIAEVLAFDSALDAEQVESIVDYLNAKYAVF